MTDLEKMIGNEVKELKTLYDMSEAEYDRRSEEGENIDLIDYVSDVLDTEYILDSNFICDFRRQPARDLLRPPMPDNLVVMSVYVNRRPSERDIQPSTNQGKVGIQNVLRV